MPSGRKSGIQIAWKTVTYRSVILMIFGVLGLMAVGTRLAFPEFTEHGVKAASNVLTNLLEHLAEPANSGGSASGAAQQAHITALDGTVRIKKANSNSWVRADYNIPLDKGDVIQTGSEGMAKIVFNDGTNYTVKQDSLIVIEENSANQHLQTDVVVRLNTGTVDLTTATYTQGSRSQVDMDGATASIGPDSAARVVKDPKSTQDELLITKGSGTVERNGETLALAGWEKVSFTANAEHMEKVKEIGPPTPISPANMMPIFVASDSKPVEFSWSPMVNAKGYHLQISRNPYFSSLVVDRRITSPAVLVSGLAEGPYYWLVQSYDAGGRESVESERNRFTIIARQPDDNTIALEIDPLIQHGHVIELTGKTEGGARVMVNGHEVPVIASDGSFHYFMPPLPSGESVITITAQNTKGGVNTQQQKVVIQ
ncbi:MAG: FecR domain-containing protein [Acidobacteria bacterium]|nr:FecR domain-containing protein [Acidobacteriota bacterium]